MPSHVLLYSRGLSPHTHTPHTYTSPLTPSPIQSQSFHYSSFSLSQVEFSYTIGFSYSYGAGCDETKIGEYVNKTLNHGQHPTSTWK